MTYLFRLQNARDWLVVYRLVGKTGRSKATVNRTHQNSEWKFPWDARIPFPRTFLQGRVQTEKLGTSSRSKWNAHFSAWKFCLGILDKNSIFWLFNFRDNFGYPLESHFLGRTIVKAAMNKLINSYVAFFLFAFSYDNLTAIRCIFSLHFYLFTKPVQVCLIYLTVRKVSVEKT